MAVVLRRWRPVGISSADEARNHREVGCGLCYKHTQLDLGVAGSSQGLNRMEVGGQDASASCPRPMRSPKTQRTPSNFLRACVS